MTFKVTIWNKEQSFGYVRDYRKPVWGGRVYYSCHGMNKVLQGLVNSKSVNPTAAGQVTNPDPVAAQQAATNAVANQGSKATQTNPVAGAERRAVTNVG